MQVQKSDEDRVGVYLARVIRRRGRSEVGIFWKCETYSDEEDKNRRHKNKPQDAIDVKIHGERKVWWIHKRERQWKEYFFVTEKLSLSNYLPQRQRFAGFIFIFIFINFWICVLGSGFVFLLLLFKTHLDINSYDF